MVLPKKQELDNIAELDISGYMNPTEEVGGDYYDVIRYKDRIKIGIGDVTGHGLESGVVMLMVQTAVRTLLENNVTNPEIFLDALNRSIFANIRRMDSDKNLTLSLIDYHLGSLKIVGQHEEVLLVRKNGLIERIDTIDLGFMVGLIHDINPYLKHYESYLNPGDGIVLYTDGVTEAMDIKDNLYGLDKLCKVVSSNWVGTSSEFVQTSIVEDVRSYIGDARPLDDVTILVIKRKH
jgi:sigma-B regulation protein RsbU (phosphoserine phosphatase)